MKQYAAILIGIVFALSAVTASAETYMYMDNGVLVFTDTPRHGSVPVKSYNTSAHAKSKARIIKSYEEYINKASRKYGIDAGLIKAVIAVESNFNEFAISKKGAMGLMQLMPLTASELGVHNVFDPQDNIDAGTKYLKRLITKFDGNLQLALAAYNAGPTTVEKHGTVPPYKETRSYVSKVFSRYKGEPTVHVKKSKTKKVYRVKMDDGSIFFTNDESLARRASKL
jgi:soluble lytic murein transglycosylase-like protein